MMEPLDGVEVNEYGQITAKVNGIFFNFLVDAGATLALLNDNIPQISGEKVLIKGVVGEELKYLSLPLLVVILARKLAREDL